MRHAIALAIGLAAALGNVPAQAAGERPLTQQDLNHGYAQVHAGLQQLARSGKLLLVKHESDAVDTVVTTLAKQLGELAGELEQLDRDDERLSLEEDGEAVIERLQDKAIMADRLDVMKPVSGKTGRRFERELLLTYMAGLHQLRFLASELDTADADRRRSAYLGKAVATIDAARRDVEGLLEKDYFR